MLAATPDWIHQGLASLLSPTDANALTLEVATELLAAFQSGLASGEEGWWEDNVTEMVSWGFDLADIQTPVQLWHGAQDRFVPLQHGQWLAAHIPGVDAHLTEIDGRLTLTVNRVPQSTSGCVAAARPH